MSEPSFPPESRPFPEGQIRAVEPPKRYSEDEPDRRAPRVPIAESYRHNSIRVWPTIHSRVLDIVPSPGTPSDGPDVIFGPSDEVVHVVGGHNAFGRACTPDDNVETLARLAGLLDLQRWTWSPATVFPQPADWVEQGALIRGAEQDEVIELARWHGQGVILRWDCSGLAPVDTDPQPTSPVSQDPVPVIVRPARLGCPMQGGVEDWCKRYGGPWTSSSMTAALVWETHRKMLVEALGCTVCHGGPVAMGSPGGSRDLFVPTREGGWQWGSPRLTVRMVDGRIHE